MTVVTTTYTPPNGTKIGLSGVWVRGSASAWSTSTINYIYTNGTDYATMIALPAIALIINDAGVYRFFPISQTVYNNATSGAWDGSGWTATSSYKHDAYISQSLLGGTSHAWYYAPIYDLGTVKNVSISTESPQDAIGLPGSTDTSTLVFDVEGVVTTIKVSGSFFGTASAIAGKISTIKNLMTGSQYTGNPCTFYWEGEMGPSGESMPYNVSVKNFSFKRSEKDVGRVDYDLTMTRRAVTV